MQDFAPAKSVTPIHDSRPQPTTRGQPKNGLHWAVARVAKVMSANGTGSLSQDGILAIEELQSHVMHVEHFRSLAEDVIVRWVAFQYAEPC